MTFDISTYRALRDVTGATARESLIEARRLKDKGESRYRQGARGYRNRPFKAESGGLMLWIERPAHAGLRFVDYADKLNRHIEHKGYYIDSYQSETMRGVVYQMATRGDSLMFMIGYECPYNPGAVCFSLEPFKGDANESRGDYGVQSIADTDSAYDAAARADRIAERCAETARESHDAHEAGRLWAETREELKAVRVSLRAPLSLARVALNACKAYGDDSGVKALARGAIEAARDAIQAARHKRRRLRARMATLAAGDDESHGFYAGDERRRRDFNEGAECEAIPRRAAPPVDPMVQSWSPGNGYNSGEKVRLSRRVFAQIAHGMKPNLSAY